MKLRDEIIGQNFVLDTDDEKRNTSLFSVQEKICSVDVSWFLFFCFTSSVSGMQSKCQIIRQFTRLHLRGMELANILSEWLRNPGNRTSESQNRKNFPRGTCTLTPPEAWAFGARLGNPSVFILIRSATTVHTFITAQSRNPDGYLCILSIPNLTPIMFWNRKGPKKPVRGLTGNTAAFAGYFT